MRGERDGREGSEHRGHEMIQPGTFYEKRDDGRWNIYMDATMCSVFDTCPQMFYYNFVQSINPKGDRPFVRDLGSWWSSVMENIYVPFSKGEPVPLEEIPQLALQIWDKMQMDELEKLAPKKWKEFGGRYGAVTMIASYATTQLPVDYATWKIIAAEASFGRNREVCIGESDTVVLYWMGQPDLYVISGGRIFPVDHKSVSYIDLYIHLRYKPNVQIPGYIVAGQILAKDLGIDLPIDRAVINVVARTDRTDKTDTGKFPRFKRVSISYSPSEIEEWKNRRIRDAERLRHCFETGHWPWVEYICNSYYWKRCPYANIDEKEPNIRPIIIAADYLKRDPWIPGRVSEKGEDD